MPSEIKETYFYYESSINGLSPLAVRCFHSANADLWPCPLLVLVHDFRGTSKDLIHVAKHYAEKGLLILIPEMRGYGDCAGDRDFGCWEIFDIVDAIATVYEKLPAVFPPIKKRRTSLGSVLKANNPDFHIWGFLGGGTTVYSALAKLPYLFRTAASFFGVPNMQRFYELKLRKDINVILRNFIGGTPEQKKLAYQTRNHVPALRNTLTRLHVIWDKHHPVYKYELVKEILDLNLPNVIYSGTEYGDPFRWDPVHFSRHMPPEGYALLDEQLLEEIFNWNPITPERHHFLVDYRNWNYRFNMKTTDTLYIPGYLITPLFIAIINTGCAGVGHLYYNIHNEALRGSKISVEIFENGKQFNHPIDAKRYMELTIYDVDKKTPFELRFL